MVLIYPRQGVFINITKRHSDTIEVVFSGGGDPHTFLRSVSRVDPRFTPCTITKNEYRPMMMSWLRKRQKKPLQFMNLSVKI